MTSRQILGEVSPKLGEMTVDMLCGDIWEQPELSKRDRSLITVANLVALYRTDQLNGHIGRALDNGVTRFEISEVILHTTF
ncbi:MAG: 4-carboxymuconolactone decarboxylase [Chloroflexi bacterium]|jgi:4-carboxymuconolactone decarboxylase|nr:4-carboxymuconolactone decarboxylase [Chloroflexota bacterium]MDP6496300.1 carboxymuconolactone decarboxylase family protein [Dehalococcoidia bacterium]|tara:strand:- start:200 stop:442 length:243 start_codon:yes stop_codon:yes gene_type:complete